MLREELSKTERVFINRIDLLKNMVKSKMTKNESHQLGQKSYTYGSTVPVHQTYSTLQTSPNEVNRSQYQTSFVPNNQGEKRDYSFSYQKGITAW